MRKVLIGLAAALAVVVGLVLAAPLLIPADSIGRQIASYVSDKTGRALQIGGPVHIAWLPRIKVTADEVSLANAPGGAARHLFEAQRVEASLRFLPLLRGRIEADEIRLTGATLNLEIDGEGHRNWVFRERSAAGASTAGPSERPFVVRRVAIGNGTASYLDRRRNRRFGADRIDLTASLPEHDGKAELQGSAAWNGETVGFVVVAASLDGLQRQAGSEATVIVTGAPLGLDFRGRLSLGPQPHAAGKIGVKAASLRRLLVWMKASHRPRGADVGQMSIDAKIEAGPQSVSLADAAIAVGDTSVKGALAFKPRAAGQPARLSGRLTADRIDLAGLLGEAPAAAPAPVLMPGAVLGLSKPAEPSGPASPPGPTPTPTGTSLDLASLTKLDADLDLDTAGLRFGAFESGKTAAALHLKGGRLALDIAEMTLYGGKVAGSVTVAATWPTPSLAAKLTLTAVDTQPLLTALLGIGALTGKGNLTIDWQATGDNRTAVLDSLAGTGSISLANGTLSGAYVDPSDTVVVPALGNGSAARPAGKLAYTSLTASYAISHGILTNTDLKLTSPQMTATGQGFINLPPCRVDYRWAPVIPGKGSAQIAISGPCDDLAYRAMSVTITPNPKK